MFRKLKNRFYNFVENDKQYPFLSGLASGLYPVLYYYGFNFTFVNSWNHLIFFIVNFLFLPMVLISLIYYITKKVQRLNFLNKYVLSSLGIAVFMALIIMITYGFNYSILIGVTLISLVIGGFLYNYSKNILVFQLLLALIVSLKLGTHLYHYFGSSSQWLLQPDNIENVRFKIKPNIYLIQPDGYIGFSKVNEPPYGFDNSNFKNFLETCGFEIQPNYRSNYYSTLSSNASLFAMKHHFFNDPKYSANELYHSRKIIAGNNPVHSIFKQNGYTTHLLLENSYMLVNKPTLHYDYCNIKYDEMFTLSRGFDQNFEVIQTLKNIGFKKNSSPKFFFIEKIIPGHISNNKNHTSGKIKERERYLERLTRANQWLKDLITLINSKDENALIIIASDHGGFVGLDHSMQCREVLTDEKIINSIYSGLLAVKFPKDVPKFTGEIKSAVNLFRIVFSYLSKEEKYLKALQSNESYTLIDHGPLFGTYKVINDHGKVVFEQHEK